MFFPTNDDRYTYKIVRHFAAAEHRSRVVVLTGPPGVGKCDVAKWTCEWLKWEVPLFPDGIFWLDCTGSDLRKLCLLYTSPSPRDRG